MVERPIKKSERQAKPEGESSESVAKVLPTLVPTVSPVTLPTRTVDRPTLNKDKNKDQEKESGSRDNDRGKGRGRGKGRDEEPRQMVSPALLRGPKPTKPKPPEPEAEVLPDTSEEAVAESVTAEEALEAVAVSESA